MAATKRYHIAKKWFDGERLHKAGSVVVVPADMKVPRGWTEITPDTVVEELQTPDDKMTAHAVQHGARSTGQPSGPAAVPAPAPGGRRVVRKKASSKKSSD